MRSILRHRDGDSTEPGAIHYTTMRAAGMGVDWIRRCATVLARALELARKRGLIDSNPSKDAARPRTNRVKPFAPTNEEVRKLLEVVTRVDPELADMATILASTGMRKGELLGLQWSDVDTRRGEVSVSAAVTDGGPGVGLLRKRPNDRIGATCRSQPLLLALSNDNGSVDATF